VLKQRLVRVLVGALIVVAPFAAIAPAGASQNFIGKSGVETRCYNAGYLACLYFGNSAGTSINNAHWPTNTSWSNLSDHAFWQDGQPGAGTNVMNWAGAMYCGYVNLDCTTYSQTGYNGNSDYELSNEVGKLSAYTYNKAASIKLR
jgi:hypothetical protein